MAVAKRHEFRAMQHCFLDLEHLASGIALLTAIIVTEGYEFGTCSDLQ